MKKLLDLISSMKTALYLFAALAVACTVATFLPQEAANRHIYGSFWFIGILFFLFISTTACTIKRVFSGFKAGTFFLHAGIILIMAGALAGSLLGVRGMILFSEGETALTFLKDGTDKELPIPFALKLNKFSVEYYPHAVENTLIINGLEKLRFDAPGKYKDIEVVRIIRDFVIDEKGDPVSRSDEWKNPAVHVRCGGDESWIFAYFPEFHGDMKFCGKSITYDFRASGGEVKEFTSDVDVMEDGKSVLNKKITVNHPLDHKGYSIYQASFDAKKPGWTGLIIKKDPGLPYIYAGFIILTIGLFIILYKRLK